MSPVLTRVSSGQGFSSLTSYKRAYLSRGSGAYQIARSLRFNSADSAYLNRTPASAGNRTTWTWSGWVKRSALQSGTSNTYMQLFSAGTGITNRDVFFFDTDTDDTLAFYSANGIAGVATLMFRTNAVFRDASAWMHVMLAVDTTQATAANRVKLYVNGTEQTFSTVSYPSLNAEGYINLNNTHYIATHPQLTEYFSGYLADIHFIDGQALTPSSFGQTDINNEWQPKQYSGTYGTNGFKLNFSDNSDTTATTLGKDSSGNNNNFTPTKFEVAPASAYKDANFNVGTQTGGTDLPASAMFDGSLLTGWGAGMSPATLKWILTNSVSIPAGTLEVYANGGPGDYSGYWYVTVKNAAGTTLTSSNITSSTAAWYSLGSTLGNIKEIWLTFVGNNPSAYAGGGIYGFRIGSQQLVWSDNYTFNDSLVDTPTSYGTDTGVGAEVRGNYCTWNPLCRSSSYATISNGNLNLAVTTNDYGYSGTLFVPNSGKWYFEVTLSATTGNGPAIGIVSAQAEATDMYDSSYASGLEYGGPVYAYNPGQGTKMSQSASTSYVTAASPSANDVFMVAVDFDNGAIYFGKNGTWLNSGVPTSGATKTGAAFTSIDAGSYAPVIHAWGTGITGVLNAGQRAFAYTAPSGFKALCDTNLSAPTIALPSNYVGIVTYTGTGSNQTVSGFGFSPDFVWIKARNDSAAHILNNSVVGTGSGKALYSNGTDLQGNLDQYGYLSALTSDGFTTQGGSGGDPYQLVSSSINNYVAWAWDAASSNSTNNDGSIQSTIRANTTAGFSIVTFTGSSGNQTIGHGLGAVPQLIFLKYRNGASGWYTYHGAVASGNNNLLKLNSTDPVDSSANYWNSTPPTSSVFTLGSGLNTTNTWVGYCFAPITGYSAFGKYTGTSGQNFVHLGFRPKLLMIKNSSSGSYPTYTGWAMFDSTRSTYNVVSNAIFANKSQVENLRGNGGSVTVADFSLDLLSNGFCLRDNGASEINLSGNTYIYAAWAENPFQYSRAR